MARIAIAGFGQETNSFTPEVVSYAYFNTHRDRPPMVRGAEIFDWLAEGPFPITSVIRELKSAHDLVPLTWCHGSAGGIVSGSAFERITAEMLGRLSEALPVDAVFLDLHGAMVAENFEDTEGEILRRTRAIVGEDVPIVVALDYHANVTPEMVEYSDSLLIYLTYPHVDRPQTGVRCAEVLRVLLEKGRPKGRAFRSAPFMIPVPAQCTLIQPAKGIVEMSRHLDGDLVSLAFAAGFGYSDIYWSGAAVSAHAFTQAEADAAADAMEARLLAAEPDLKVRMYSAEEAISYAMERSGPATKPFVLADWQDNPGGGGSSDTTGILKALVAAGATEATLGIFADPEACAAAHAAGEGAEIDFALGGKHGPEGVTPLTARFRVKKLGNGQMMAHGPMVGGSQLDLGPMALLEIGGVEVVTASKRMQAYDRAAFDHLGVDLESRKIIVVKSSVHFRAQFDPLAEETLVVKSPGYVADDLENFPYRNLRPGLRLVPMGKGFGES